MDNNICPWSRLWIHNLGVIFIHFILATYVYFVHRHCLKSVLPWDDNVTPCILCINSVVCRLVQKTICAPISESHSFWEMFKALIWRGRAAKELKGSLPNSTSYIKVKIADFWTSFNSIKWPFLFWTGAGDAQIAPWFLSESDFGSSQPEMCLLLLDSSPI